MSKKLIKIAPYNNKEAWKDADYICDGIDDQVEIQAALDTASDLKRDVLMTYGTYLLEDDATLNVEGVILYDTLGFYLMLDRAVESEPEAFCGFDKTKNIQEQLQKIMLKSFVNTTRMLNAFWGYFHYSKDLLGFPNDAPINQLWLASLMHKCFHKVWVTEDWEVKSEPDVIRLTH